ncbi:hypothetical protein [Desulfosporosinus meridiei]|uniref:Uncharacterized protein n=1 Tax=Desulfosporosinus meridiei (strain ATCC BAA-275 / DSM 13257 / KCTC 12902 / NCIMB 13706 / S10) TaxID=768704 RepID=J7IPH4_DESMD|nr:hypothetical protein [Desulfosporosinus meridiei]AFQ43742.1 hypothetical protein Desmer_1775 [Desulfosporosinus meridiei DSM 13257]
MNKIKILEVLNDALQNELEIEKVIILYTNGETFEIDSEAEEGEEDIIPQLSENAALNDDDVNDDVRLVEFPEIDELDKPNDFQELAELPETKEVESVDSKDNIATIVLEGNWTHINYLPFSRKINIIN